MILLFISCCIILNRPYPSILFWFLLTSVHDTFDFFCQAHHCGAFIHRYIYIACIRPLTIHSITDSYLFAWLYPVLFLWCGRTVFHLWNSFLVSFGLTWLGLALLGLIWPDLTWLGFGLTWLDLTWPELAWPDLARLDLAWFDLTSPDLTWLGMTWLSLAWFDLTWHGLTWLSLTRLGLMWLVVP